MPLLPDPFKLLSDTDENDAIGTPSPTTTKSLSELAEAPASELFVLQEISRLCRLCWPKRWIRRFRLRFAVALAFGLGVFVAVQIGGFWFLRSALRDLDARTANTVIQVLKDHKIISGVAPAPVTGEAVAYAVSGGSTP